MIFSSTEISQSWKEVFYSGLTCQKFDQFVAENEMIQVENNIREFF